MLVTRKIGTLLRGRATPFQVMAACVLGSWLGFVPGLPQAPGWTACVAGMLLVLNANLGLALVAAGLARLTAVALVEPTFRVGQALLDGPTRGLFRALVEAPGTAWFGFEHYLTTGGIAVGLVFGAALGAATNVGLRAFRRAMASAESSSERYRAWSSKRSVRVLIFVFAGKGKGKRSYEELLVKRVGLPIRPVGVAVVAVAVGAAYFARDLVAEPIVTEAVRSELARANGATVDVGGVELDLAGGKLAVRGLAICDPDDLSRDLLRAAELVADVDVSDLLRRRFTLERVVVRGARHGAPRAQPGTRFEPESAEQDEVEPPPADDAGEERTLDDVLENARAWKEKLAEVRERIEGVLGDREPDGAPDADDGGTIEERVSLEGWAKVVSRGLLRDVPAFTVDELVLEGLTGLGAGTVDLVARHLSTHPHLLAEDPAVRVTTPDGRFELDLGVDADRGGDGRVVLRAEGLDLDAWASGLEADGTPLLSGGTLDVSLVGGWRGRLDDLDLPLAFTLKNTSVRLPGREERVPLDELVVPVSLRGALDAPRFQVDVDDLTDRVLAAGQARLDRELGERKDALEAEVRAEADAARAALEQRVAAEKKAAEEKLLDAAVQALEGELEAETLKADLKSDLGKLLGRPK